MKKVVDLMSANPPTVQNDTPVGECAALLVNNRIRHLVVVDEAGQFAGVVADYSVFENGDYSKRRGWSPRRDKHGVANAGDLKLEAAVTAAAGDSLIKTLVRLAKSIQDFAIVVEDGEPVGIITEHMAVEEAVWQLSDDVSVDEFGSTDLATVGASETTKEAWELLQSRQIRHLPVVEAGELLGVLSFRDILETDAENDDDRPCLEVASTGVLTAKPGAKLREVADTMARQRVGCIPIVKDRRIHRIITRTDVLVALVNQLVQE